MGGQGTWRQPPEVARPALLRPADPGGLGCIITSKPVAEYISFYLAQGFVALWFILALGTCFLSWAHYICVGQLAGSGVGGCLCPWSSLWVCSLSHGRGARVREGLTLTPSRN